MGKSDRAKVLAAVESIPRRNPFCRRHQDRALPLNVRSTFLQHADYRGRKKSFRPNDEFRKSKRCKLD